MASFYFIGIGGAGMSVVAQLLLAQGHQIQGSDREASDITDFLASLGIVIHIGHDASNLPSDAVVVLSTAIKDSNPELAQARRRGQKIIHRSQALAYAARDKDFVAIAGAHGKTSTSAMLAVALEYLGRDPSRAIGGSLAGGASGGYCGSGRVFVAEADESDASFLNYSPRVEIVTNIEPDHLDFYGTREAFEQAFVDFAHCLTPTGLLIACADDPGALQLARQAAAEGVRVCTYGRCARPNISGRGYEGHAQLIAHDPDVSADATGACGTVVFRGTREDLRLAVPGDHMLLNAVGAWLAGVELGEDGAQMARALTHFRGAHRRFETVGTVGEIEVVDDYAHHPTEIAATLRTARECARGHVRVLFQPHLYSRTRNFAHEFASALSLADSVIVTSVYAAREVPADGVEGNVIADLMQDTPYISDMHEAGEALAEQAEPGDMLITMGAGSITHVGAEILQHVRNRLEAGADS